MTERLSDTTDIAARNDALYREQAEARRAREEQRRLAEYRRAIDDGDADGRHCMDCYIELPEQRQLDHRLRCTGCQTILEKRTKR